MNYYCCSGFTSEGFESGKIKFLNPDGFKYILKGHPNSVKQNIFNCICERLEKNKVEYTVYKSYDGSIQGVMCEENGFLICDGTYPFNEKSETYGVNDREIHLDMFQSSKLLKSKSSEITEINKELEIQIRRCKRFLEASESLLKERRRLEKDSVDTRKISRYCNKQWSNYGCYPSGRVGVEKSVFSSVATKDGVAFVGDNLLTDCDTGIVIADTVGNVSSMIIDRIRRYALGSGVDIISGKSCFNSDENMECLIIPSMRFGVFKENKRVEFNISNIKRVRAGRFLLDKANENIKIRLQFNQRANEALMKEVSSSIEKIEELKDKRDYFYQQATDEKALTDYVLNTVI